jgi:murein DD-endopeptidase MepM/ murein hydrolase activator NlpD
MLFALAVGCASTTDSENARDSGSGVTHILRPGENLYRLSQFYGVSVDAIVRANQIADVTDLQVGERLWIPNAKRTPPPDSLAARGGVTASTGGSARARDADLRLVWPVRGRLSSRFGWRNGSRHEGVDIPAKPGTPIRAAAAGRVIHSGTVLGDYGRVVIVKHVGSYSSVYAHNRRNRVKEGDFVEQGELIGEVGSSGNASGPHVHFEVRRGSRAVDPLRYLP